MKKYLITIGLLLSNQALADCLFPKEYIGLAEATGGAVSCYDKEYYANKEKGTAVERKGIEGNCVAKDGTLYCKSGTTIQYKSKEEIKYAAETKRKLDSTPIKSFSPINEPNWFNRPNEPGDWYGDSCIARVWEIKENGNKKLIMYRHGGRESVHANIDGNDLTGLALQEADTSGYKAFVPHDFGKIDFSSTISLADKDGQKWRNSLYMLTRKVGKCEFETQSSKCVRAEGVITQQFQNYYNDDWRIKEPIKVVVEDSCGKHKNSNFLDDRPFTAKIRLPH